MALLKLPNFVRIRAIFRSQRFASEASIRGKLFSEEALEQKSNATATFIDAKVAFFSRAWSPEKTKYRNTGGCSEVLIEEPYDSILDIEVMDLPLQLSTRLGLVNTMSINKLLPFQWVALNCFLGKRDMLLWSRPCSGKSLGLLIGLIEAATSRLKKLTDSTNGKLQLSQVNHNNDLIKQNSVFQRKISNSLFAVVICCSHEAAIRANQLCNVLAREHPCKLRSVSLTGASSMHRDIDKLTITDQPHIIFGTLGRVWDHINYTEGFSKKLKEVKMLIVDDAEILIQSLTQTDSLRALRTKLNPKLQTIMMTGAADESIKRLLFRMLKTNFLLVNCVEGFDKKHRFNYERYLSNLPRLSDDEFTSKDQHLSVVHPNLLAIPSGSPRSVNSEMLASFLNNKIQQEVSIFDSKKISDFSNVLNADENHFEVSQVSKERKNADVSCDEELATMDKIETLAEEPARKIWITRTSEAAMRSSMCPTPSRIRIFSYIYNPEDLAHILCNFIKISLACQKEKAEKDTHVFDLNHISGDENHKLIFIFSSVRMTEFFALLFYRYLTISKILGKQSNNHDFCVLHSNLSPSNRERNVRRFREAKCAVLFATSVACLADLGQASTIVQIGTSNNPNDFIRHSGVVSQEGQGGRIVCLVNPMELKYLEELLSLRIPIQPLPEMICSKLNEVLDDVLLKEFTPSRHLDFQAQDTIGEKSPILNAIVDPIEYYNRYEFWYKDPFVMAACQLMYRSLIGFYVSNHKELKINRVDVPDMLHEILKGMGLCTPPPIPVDFARHSGIVKVKGLNFAEIPLDALESLVKACQL